MRSSTEDASLRREIASHLQLLEKAYQRRGRSVAEARRFAWIDNMRRDLYYAAWILAGNVAFTLVVVLTIGLGTGGTTAVFGLINARLFSGPAHARADNL